MLISCPVGAGVRSWRLPWEKPLCVPACTPTGFPCVCVCVRVRDCRRSDTRGARPCRPISFLMAWDRLAHRSSQAVSRAAKVHVQGVRG